MSYDLARGLHIIAVIAWMAGLLMLPRLYAYQSGSEPGGELEKKMIVAAGALRRIILTPALILTWGLGLYLLGSYLIGDWSGGPARIAARVPAWFWVKLVLVLTLSGYQGYLFAEGRRLGRGERRRSERFWRTANELPFLIAIAVVLLATLEPWGAPGA